MRCFPILRESKPPSSSFSRSEDLLSTIRKFEGAKAIDWSLRVGFLDRRQRKMRDQEHYQLTPELVYA